MLNEILREHYAGHGDDTPMRIRMYLDTEVDVLSAVCDDAGKIHPAYDELQIADFFVELALGARKQLRDRFSHRDVRYDQLFEFCHQAVEFLLDAGSVVGEKRPYAIADLLHVASGSAAVLGRRFKMRYQCKHDSRYMSAKKGAIHWYKLAYAACRESAEQIQHRNPREASQRFHSARGHALAVFNLTGNIDYWKRYEQMISLDIINRQIAERSCQEVDNRRFGM